LINSNESTGAITGFAPIIFYRPLQVFSLPGTPAAGLGDPMVADLMDSFAPRWVGWDLITPIDSVGGFFLTGSPYQFTDIPTSEGKLSMTAINNVTLTAINLTPEPPAFITFGSAMVLFLVARNYANAFQACGVTI
jgi:hypothetical protein